MGYRDHHSPVRSRLSAAAAVAGTSRSYGAPDEGRGRLASAPSEISARGWKDILLRVFHNNLRTPDHCSGRRRDVLHSAGHISCHRGPGRDLWAVSDPATLTVHLEKLSGLLPGGAIDVIRDELTRVASQRGSTLGLTFIVGLAVSLWSANAAMKSVFDTLNVAYAETEARSLIKLNAISLAFTAAGIVFVLVAIAALVVLPSALKYLERDGSSLNRLRIPKSEGF
ncbi:YihY/virulence factor BrkB family protein [Bradyrhizobium sp. 170]|uniref:YihY/virulence factor BrkB family protein n=1 Tax=Bradyrhizobium sp. 170 TaxID=2782641 RepID=UPI003211E1DA